MLTFERCGTSFMASTQPVRSSIGYLVAYLVPEDGLTLREFGAGPLFEEV
jgi:hypothetical protein